MTRMVPTDPVPAPARNDAAWPALAALLAPAAGCECQMLAIALAERMSSPPAPAAGPATTKPATRG